jgi:hypothetical protein
MGECTANDSTLFMILSRDCGISSDALDPLVAGGISPICAGLLIIEVGDRS